MCSENWSGKQEALVGLLRLPGSGGGHAGQCAGAGGWVRCGCNPAAHLPHCLLGRCVQAGCDQHVLAGLGQPGLPPRRSVDVQHALAHSLVNHCSGTGGQANAAWFRGSVRGSQPRMVCSHAAPAPAGTQPGQPRAALPLMQRMRRHRCNAASQKQWGCGQQHRGSGLQPCEAHPGMRR